MLNIFLFKQRTMVPGFMIHYAILFTLCCASLYGCDIGQVQRCMGPIDFIQIVPDGDVFPYYDDEQLLLICRSYTNTSDCLEPVRKKCRGSAERNKYDGTEKALSFLCGEGKTEYKTIRKCVTNKGYIATRCNTTYSKNIQSLEHVQASLREKKRLLCRFVFEFAACIQVGINNVCGSDAGHWVHTIKMALLTPTLEAIRCQRDISLSPPAIIGIIGSIFLLLSTIFGTIYICQKQQKQGKCLLKKRHRSSSWGRSTSLPSCATKSIVDCQAPTSVPLISEREKRVFTDFTDANIYMGDKQIQREKAQLPLNNEEGIVNIHTENPRGECAESNADNQMIGASCT